MPATSSSRGAALRGFLTSGQGWPYLLVPFIPVAIVLWILDAPPVAVFFTSAAGVIPTAALMSRSTEELAERAGPGIGGLLNVTFGNAPELIIALFALAAGLEEVVKASLVGSVLGNLLLVAGAAMTVGGARRHHQSFNATAANAQSSMLLLAIVAFGLMALLALVDGHGLPEPGGGSIEFPGDINGASAAVAAVLVLVYGGWLWFSLRSHRALFNPPDDEGEEGHEPWSIRRSMVMLAIAGAAVAIMSEVLVDSIEAATESIGLSEFFVGVIVVAIVGNAAEHWVAVVVAAKNKMDLALNIALGSSAQIALFALPVVVLASFALGPHPMALVLNPFELGGIVLAVLIANHVTHEGQTTWYEGVLLLGVYAVLAIVFAVA